MKTDDDVINQWPFSGPGAPTRRYASLDLGDLHVRCFKCLGKQHALQALFSDTYSGNEDEDEDNSNAKFPPASGSADPMRQLKANFPELIRAAVAMKVIPLPTPPPCSDGMVGDKYCLRPSSKKPLLSRVPAH